MRRQLGVTSAQGTGSVASFADYCARARFAADLHRRHISVRTQSIAARGDMSATRLRSEIDKIKTDDSSSGIERLVGVENVVRGRCCVDAGQPPRGFLLK